MDQDHENIVVFWDYASTHACSASTSVSNYSLIGNIRSSLHEFGHVKSFRAYGNFTGPTTSTISVSTYSEFTTSGVTALNFPESGQKDAGVKMMLIDIVVHAWDHSAGNTIVIISNDRDVGYAVAVLRMRKFRVVVICSSTAHTDLTAHASDKLDWTRVALGFANSHSQSQFLEETKPTSSSHLPTSSYQQQSKQNGDGFSGFQMPKSPPVKEATMHPAHTYRPISVGDLPSHGRTRSHSVFSMYDPHKFDAFGDMTSKTNPALSTLGDEPLFPRPKPLSEERARPESVPPHMAYTSTSNLKSVFRPFSEEENSPPTWKGKGRDDSVFESESNRQTATNAYSGSIFEPFGDATTPLQGAATMPPLAYHEHKAQDARTESSSSSSSRSSKFSIVDHPVTTAPTSVATAVDKEVTSIEDQITQMIDDNQLFEPAVEKFISRANSKVSSRRNSNTTVHAIKTEKATSPMTPPLMTPPHMPPVMPEKVDVKPSTPTGAATSQKTITISTLQPVQPSAVPSSTSKPIARPSTTAQTRPSTKTPAAQLPKPAASTSAQVNNPRARFQPLIAVLRREQNELPDGTPKSRLGELLPRQNPAVYTLANVQRFGTYIAAAIKAGVVRETMRGECVELTPQYA